MLQCCGMGQGVQYDGAWVGVCGARGGGGGVEQGLQSTRDCKSNVALKARAW